MLAQVDYDIVGAGTADFDFFTNTLISPLFEPPQFFDSDFGVATLTVVTVPEPSSAILLLLGAAEGLILMPAREETWAAGEQVLYFPL